MSKEKPKKYKNLKKKEPVEPDEEVTTALAFPEARTHIPTQTSMPILKKQPQWVYRSGSAKIMGWGLVGGFAVLNMVRQL